MAEQALAVRSATNEHLRTQLATERSEKSEVRARRGGHSRPCCLTAAGTAAPVPAPHSAVWSCPSPRSHLPPPSALPRHLSPPLAPHRRPAQVQKTSSAAQEESVFLAEHMQSLMDERAALRKELERAQRAQEYLTSENELLRQELLGGWPALCVWRAAGAVQEEGWSASAAPRLCVPPRPPARIRCWCRGCGAGRGERRHAAAAGAEGGGAAGGAGGAAGGAAAQRAAGERQCAAAGEGVG